MLSLQSQTLGRGWPPKRPLAPDDDAEDLAAEQRHKRQAGMPPPQRSNAACGTAAAGCTVPVPQTGPSPLPVSAARAPSFEFPPNPGFFPSTSATSDRSFDECGNLAAHSSSFHRASTSEITLGAAAGLGGADVYVEAPTEELSLHVQALPARTWSLCTALPVAEPVLPQPAADPDSNVFKPEPLLHLSGQAMQHLAVLKEMRTKVANALKHRISRRVSTGKLSEQAAEAMQKAISSKLVKPVSLALQRYCAAKRYFAESQACLTHVNLLEGYGALGLFSKDVTTLTDSLANAIVKAAVQAEADFARRQEEALREREREREERERRRERERAELRQQLELRERQQEALACQQGQALAAVAGPAGTGGAGEGCVSVAGRARVSQGQGQGQCSVADQRCEPSLTQRPVESGTDCTQPLPGPSGQEEEVVAGMEGVEGLEGLEGLGLGFSMGKIVCRRPPVDAPHRTSFCGPRGAPPGGGGGGCSGGGAFGGELMLMQQGLPSTPRSGDSSDGSARAGAGAGSWQLRAPSPLALTPLGPMAGQADAEARLRTGVSKSMALQQGQSRADGAPALLRQRCASSSGDIVWTPVSTSTAQQPQQQCSPLPQQQQQEQGQGQGRGQQEDGEQLQHPGQRQGHEGTYLAGEASIGRVVSLRAPLIDREGLESLDHEDGHASGEARALTLELPWAAEEEGARAVGPASTVISCANPPAHLSASSADSPHRVLAQPRTPEEPWGRKGADDAGHSGRGGDDRMGARGGGEGDGDGDLLGGSATRAATHGDAAQWTTTDAAVVDTKHSAVAFPGFEAAAGGSEAALESPTFCAGPRGFAAQGTEDAGAGARGDGEPAAGAGAEAEVEAPAVSEAAGAASEVSGAAAEEGDVASGSALAEALSSTFMDGLEAVDWFVVVQDAYGVDPEELLMQQRGLEEGQEEEEEQEAGWTKRGLHGSIQGSYRH